MTLQEKIDADYLIAYKAKDALVVGVLRLLKTAVKNFQVDSKRLPDDAEMIDLIAKQAKQRQDSIEQFTQAGRLDLAEKESAELAVLRGYMPTPLEGAELDAAIVDIMGRVEVTSMRDMGKVMQALMSEYKGRVDGKNCSAAVKKALAAALS